MDKKKAVKVYVSDEEKLMIEEMAELKKMSVSKLLKTMTLKYYQYTIDEYKN